MVAGLLTGDYKKRSMGSWRNTLEIDFLGKFDFPESNNSLSEELKLERGCRDKEGQRQ